jgi:hypothetical protein
VAEEIDSWIANYQETSCFSALAAENNRAAKSQKHEVSQNVQQITPI